MGKQARLKQARRAERARYQPTTGARRRGMLLWIGLAALVALAAALAAVLGRDGDGAPAGAPEPASVKVEGTALPGFDTVGRDPAVGQNAPTVIGTSANGDRLAIPKTDKPYAVVFLAHWCPHCQRELPLLVDWIRQRGTPTGVNLYGVATANDPDRPNHPAATWLEREGWQQPTLIDDDNGTAARAYGLTGFPFFVFVDEDGEVVARHAGELTIEDLSRRAASLSRDQS